MYKRNRIAARLVTLALALVMMLALCAPALAATTVYATTPINVRSGAGTKHGVIGSLNTGEGAEKLGTSGSWTKINYNGKTAYAFTKYLTTTAPVGGSGSSSSGSSSATGSVVTVTANGVNIRSGAGTKYSKLGQVTSGQTLPYLGVSGSWTQVTYNGQTAYISSQYVSYSGGSGTNVTGGTSHYTAYAVALRSSPGSDSRQIAYINAGERVQYLGTASTAWTYVQYGALKGYIPTSSLSIGSSSGIHNTTGTIYANATIRVYSSPYTTSNSLGYLRMGESATRTGTIGDWTQIVFEGRTGYVLTENLISSGSGAGYITAGFYVYPTANNTPAYSRPTASSSYLLGYFSYNESVYCEAYNGTWARIDYRDRTMYIRQSDLSMSRNSSHYYDGYYSYGSDVRAKRGYITLWNDASRAMRYSSEPEADEPLVDDETRLEYRGLASNGAAMVRYKGTTYYVDPTYIVAY